MAKKLFVSRPNSSNKERSGDEPDLKVKGIHTNFF